MFSETKETYHAADLIEHGSFVSRTLAAVGTDTAETDFQNNANGETATGDTSISD